MDELTRDAELVFGLFQQFYTYDDFVWALAMGECNALTRTSIRRSQCKLAIGTTGNAMGLEFDCVFLLGCREGNMPFSNAQAKHMADAIEQERRLFYLACSRARASLVLTYSQRAAVTALSKPPSRNIVHTNPTFTTTRLTKFVLPLLSYVQTSHDETCDLFDFYNETFQQTELETVFRHYQNPQHKNNETNLKLQNHMHSDDIGVSVLMEQLVKTCGETNLIFTSLEKQIQFTEIPCCFLTPPSLFTSVRRVWNEEDMQNILRHIVLKCLVENVDWKDVIRYAFLNPKTHWKTRLAASYLLKSGPTTTTLGLPPTVSSAHVTWFAFMQSLQELCEQLRAGLTKPVEVCGSTTPFIILDHSILIITFANNTSPLCGKYLTEMLMYSKCIMSHLNVKMSIAHLNCMQGKLVTSTRF